MRVLFTKLSDRRHRFEVVRDDGTRENVELDSRSFLLHDLVHYAVEAELRLPDAFYGLLSSGTPLSRLNDRSTYADPTPGLAKAETLVGPLQSLWNERIDPAIHLENVQRAFPEVDAALIARILERLRRLTGHWRATAYRSTMELPWPPPDDLLTK
jgi:hypothetical protein